MPAFLYPCGIPFRCFLRDHDTKLSMETRWAATWCHKRFVANITNQVRVCVGGVAHE